MLKHEMWNVGELLLVGWGISREKRLSNGEAGDNLIIYFMQELRVIIRVNINLYF